MALQIFQFKTGLGVISLYEFKKYNLKIDPETADEYFKYLTNSLYKALTVFEGRDYKTRIVIYSKEDAHDNFMLYVQNFAYEISGSTKLFYTREFVTLLAYVEEMLWVSQDEHQKLRKLVFSSINIVEDMKGRC